MQSIIICPELPNNFENCFAGKLIPIREIKEGNIFLKKMNIFISIVKLVCYKVGVNKEMHSKTLMLNSN